MERHDSILIGLVLAHFAVVVVHSVAHVVLGIVPGGLDAAFIGLVIVAGPLLALLFLRANRIVAAALLAFLLGAAFIYGVVNHFVASGPDHVALVASEPWTAVFVITAALLGVLELAAMAIAVAVLRSSLRTPSGPAAPPA